MTMTDTPDAARIRAVLDEFTAAIRNRDAAAAVAIYTDDAVAYGLAPPLSIEGQQVRDPAGIQTWFDTWASPIESKPHGLTIRVGGDIAYAFGLRHMTGTKTDGEEIDLWFRSTVCLVRQGSSWKIAHVHDSVPFAMDGTGRAMLDLKP
jgi:ketosteroid isomerase-like protein